MILTRGLLEKLSATKRSKMDDKDKAWKLFPDVSGIVPVSFAYAAVQSLLSQSGMELRNATKLLSKPGAPVSAVFESVFSQQAGVCLIDFFWSKAEKNVQKYHVIAGELHQRCTPCHACECACACAFACTCALADVHMPMHGCPS